MAYRIMYDAMDVGTLRDYPRYWARTVRTPPPIRHRPDNAVMHRERTSGHEPRNRKKPDPILYTPA